MSKSILVIDTPKTCKECPLKSDDRLPSSCVFRRWYSLSVHDTHETNNWCPLKKIPQKRKAIGILNDYEKGKILGFNACLKTILGEEE